MRLKEEIKPRQRKDGGLIKTSNRVMTEDKQTHSLNNFAALKVNEETLKEVMRQELERLRLKI